MVGSRLPRQGLARHRKVKVGLVETNVEHRIGKLARQIVEEGSKYGITCSCAESCTGGLVSGAITAVPGSSEVLRGGVVSYAVEVKHDVLGVDQDILDDPTLGPVSSECALMMCEHVASLLKSDVAVSVTGIAGPGGEEPGKPVGTVWFGIWAAGRARSECHLFTGNRDEVRLQAVENALKLVREAIVELSTR